MSVFKLMGITLLINSCLSQDYKVTPLTTSSGLYYEKIGEVLLTNSNWQFVTSVDYEGYLLFYEYLFSQANKIEEFCKKVSLKECDSRYDAIRSSLVKIEERDESMANFLGVLKQTRAKRSFFGAIGNFFKGIGSGIAGVARTIFGGGSRQVDLSAYDRQIGDLRIGQMELQNEIAQQRTLFLLDSERKQFQLEWLKKTQGEIENKVGELESTFKKDSQEKDKKLKQLNTMLNETQQKLKMQEEIQKKLIGQVNAIEKKLLKVAEDIKIINEKVENNTKRINTLELSVKLNTISIDFSFLMSQFENEQKTLFGVVKNANKGELDPYILTPLNLVEMLQDIQPKLPEGVKFPFYPNIENANRLYNVVKPSVYLYNSKVIFILQIPLVHSTIYNAHKVTSLPTQLGLKKFAFVLPQEPFLLIDNSYQGYLLLSASDFKDFCEEVEKNRYLCKQIHQVSLAHASDDCEVTLFKDPRAVPSSCHKCFMYLDVPVFLQLQQLNAWVYAVPEVEILTFTCGHNMVTERVEGTGFIEIFNDCTVRTPNFMLVSLLELTKPVASNYTPHVNITKFIEMSLVDAVQEKSKVRKQIILPFALDELSKISFPLPNHETNAAALSFGIVFTLLILAFVVVGYLGYKKKIDIRKLNFLPALYRSGTSHSQQGNNQQISNLLAPKTGSEKLQVRLKVNKNSEDIHRVSIRQDPSTNDPEAEYLTVRVKVKKNPTEKKLNNETVKNNVPIIQEESGDIGEDRYLSELRKLKPKNVNEFCIDQKS